MERKKHFKMYKSGKLWVYAAITTLSLAAVTAMNANDHAYADTNNQVQSAVTVDTPAAASSASTSSTAAAASSTNTKDTAPASSSANASSTAPVSSSTNTGSTAASSDQTNSGSAATGDHDTAKPATQNQTATSTRRIMVDGETKPLTTQTVNYTRTGTTNADGSVKWGNWTVADKGSDTWAAYNIPARDGYVATIDGKVADSVAQATATTPNNDEKSISLDVVIKYVQLHEVATRTRTITITDPDGKTTTQKQEVKFSRDFNKETGAYGSWQPDVKGKVTWDKFAVPEVKGYVAIANGKVVQSIPAQALKVDDKDQQITVTYAPLQLGGQQKTVTRTITIKEPNGNTVIEKQTVNLQQTVAKDGDKVIAEQWTTGKWDSYQMPEIAGYAAQEGDKIITTIDAADVNSDTKDVNIDVVYVVADYNKDVEDQQTGYWGWLDKEEIANNAIHVVGWHATNESRDRGHHFLIIWDKTQGKEVGRLEVKDPVHRQDVKNIHNVWNAAISGFDETIPLNLSVMHSGDQLQVVSRWTADPNGNNDPADDWFAPITPDYRTNVAYLDAFDIDNNAIHVAGWHATAQSLGRDNHYLILYDATTHRELAREEVEKVNRPDVLNAEQGVLNADKSGFDTYFDISRKAIPAGIHLSHNLQIISRYTASNDGNSNYVDYWFPAKQFFNVNAANHACLDKAEIVNGRVHVSGWHATDLSEAATNHFLILHDDTRNQDVTSILLPDSVSRPDVARVYPNIKTAANSGFDATFDQVMLTPGDHYTLISRYSTSADGNGNSGAKADYRMLINNLFNINTTNAGNVDSVVVNNGSVTVSGWNATDYSLLANNHYLILFDTTTNRQVAQAKVNNIARPDVARAYRHLRTAGNSGFSATFDQVELQPGHNYSLVSRYSISPYGNGDDGNGQDHVDHWFNGILRLNDSDYHANSVDVFTPDTKNNAIHVVGWMASDASKTMSNAYLILLDNTGKEYGREKVELTDRPDVAKAEPAIYNSGVSGFDTLIKLYDGYQLTDLVNKGKSLHLVLRFTSSTDGNSNYSDQVSRNWVITADQLKQA
jgi:hypothetical protein